MLQAILKRAEASVDNAIGNIVARALAAIPFLVAMGFATAAASNYLNTQYGPQLGNIIMAGIYCLIGVGAGVVVASRNKSQAATEEGGTAQATSTVDAPATPDPQLAAIDREFITSALTAVGPIALPTIIRMIARNLPLIVAILAAGFVLTRTSSGTDSADEQLQPAE